MYRSNNVIYGLLSSIGIIYFFILPVYIPIRALGTELQNYETVIISNLDLILFFSQITLLLACNGILLEFFFKFISKQLFNNESLILSWYRIISTIYAGVFVVTSYMVLNPQHLLQLYGWSGMHYFIISFFQLLIRSEINSSKNNNLLIPQANNYFGIVLNSSGVVSLAIFSWFYSNNYSQYYSTYCLGLELVFLSYLIFIRKYYLSFWIISKQHSIWEIITFCSLAILALGIASIVSIIFMLSGCLGVLFILGFIGYLYIKLQLDVDKSDLRLIINIGLNYGLFLAILTGSILTYFVKNTSFNMDSFNYAYSTEPFFSIIIGFIFTGYLLKKNIQTSKEALANSVFILNCIVPIVLGLFILTYIMQEILLQFLFIVFGAYSFLEYLSLFYLRQIAQHDKYKELQGAKLTNFNSIVLNGLSPALLYLLVFFLSKINILGLNQLLMIAITLLALLSIMNNLRQRYLISYEKK